MGIEKECFVEKKIGVEKFLPPKSKPLGHYFNKKDKMGDM